MRPETQAAGACVMTVGNGASNAIARLGEARARYARSGVLLISIISTWTTHSGRTRKHETLIPLSDIHSHNNAHILYKVLKIISVSRWL